MASSSPDWQLYERMIARMVADQISTDYCVTPNTRLVIFFDGSYPEPR